MYISRRIENGINRLIKLREDRNVALEKAESLNYLEYEIYDYAGVDAEPLMLRERLIQNDKESKELEKFLVESLVSLYTK